MLEGASAAAVAHAAAVAVGIAAAAFGANRTQSVAVARSMHASLLWTGRRKAQVAPVAPAGRPSAAVAADARNAGASALLGHCAAATGAESG